MAQSLIRHGSDVNCRNERYSHETALHTAVLNDFRDMVDLLLENGADPTIADDYGHIPLHVAGWYAHPELIRRLHKANGVVDPIDVDGWTPLHFALKRDGSGLIDLTKRRKAVNVLLELGADINIKNRDGKSPLDAALELGDEPIIQAVESKK